MKSEIAALNAEQYGAEAGFLSGSRPTRKAPARPAADAGPPSRKRAKVDAGSSPEKDDEPKRARGRPRLDTKDETAAEVSSRCVVKLRPG